jgi:DNA-binding NarL/FixJ family response regulator
VDTNDQQVTLELLRQVRNEALEHARRARELAVKRRELIRELMAQGLSQSDIARELGVSRQAVQKMLSF